MRIDTSTLAVRASHASRPARWPYFLPAAVALFFAGHALEDAGWAGAALYLILFGVCTIQIVFPTVAGWWLLFAPSVAFGTLVAVTPQDGPTDEWIIFMCLGFVPALGLWVGRPWRSRRKARPSERLTPGSQGDKEGA